ncbi:RraA family protein [Rhodococcus oxybenzonivorans]|uniref:RraA family protein n=1 Tax=Rhodococcus oxybenzonivorans TaxID=1990687 RepID=UPI0029549526|nr:RraA family protein [Rhodococcus oxybenzonivorans]MDV7355264.1 RraA family protein [Rhodococcus oxybenzonivorans]
MSQQSSPVSPTTARQVPATATHRDRAALLASLLQVSDASCAVSDALDQLGVGAAIGAGILAPLRRGQRICGPAVTLRYRRLTGEIVDNRADGLGARLGDRDLYSTARPGDVAVFDCPAPADTAVVGALSAQWALLAGLAGCVVGGAVRDSVSIIDSGLPVWSMARAPQAARFRYATESIGEPVRLAGRLVHPGDIIVADDDGVAVIPADMLFDVVTICVETDRIEHELLAQLRSSDSIADLMGKLRQRPVSVFDR